MDKKYKNILLKNNMLKIITKKMIAELFNIIKIY